jgi:predicted Zn-dependent protease
VLILACVRSLTYARRWNDREQFYVTSLREQPRSVRLYLLLTSEYLGQRRFDDAERIADEASRRLPDYWEVWIARANVAMERGDFAEAERLLERAIETPRVPTARVARWMMLLEQRRSATRPTSSGG